MKTLKSFLCVAIVLAATALLAVSCNNDDSSSADQKVTYSLSKVSLSSTKTGVTFQEITDASLSYSIRLTSAVNGATSDSDAISKVEAIIEDYKANWSPCTGEVVIAKYIGEKSSVLKEIKF